MDDKMKVIFVGNPKIQAALAKTLFPQWDWQQPEPTIDTFWDDSDPDTPAPQGRKKIDENTVVTLISDEFYGKSPQDTEAFLELVTAASMSSLTAIVNYRENERDQMERDLRRYAYDEKLELGQFYWINKRHPKPTMESALKQYVNGDGGDKAVKEIIQRYTGLRRVLTNDEPKHVDGSKAGGEVAQIRQPDESKFYNNYGKLGHIITSTSSKGGVGKTTVGLGVATWIAKSSAQAAEAGLLPKPLKVCVVDLDIKDAQMGFMIGESRPTVLDIIRSSVIDAEVVQKNIIYKERMGCSFLLAPKLSRSAALISPDKYRKIIQILQHLFDVIILDTSVEKLDPLLLEVAYPMADRIILVTTLDRKSVLGISRWIVEVGKPTSKGGAGIDLNKVKVVINMGMKNVEMTVGEVRQSIKAVTVRLYHMIDPTLPPDQQPVPQLITPIPNVPNGIIMRQSNANRFELVLNIPVIEQTLGKISRELLPKQFEKRLPPVKSAG